MIKMSGEPLRMNGTVVDTLDELRENFNLDAIQEYYLNGKLFIWLVEHRCFDIIMKIEDLNVDSPEFDKKIKEAFDITVELEKNEDRILVPDYKTSLIFQDILFGKDKTETKELFATMYTTLRDCNYDPRKGGEYLSEEFRKIKDSDLRRLGKYIF